MLIFLEDHLSIYFVLHFFLFIYIYIYIFLLDYFFHINLMYSIKTPECFGAGQQLSRAPLDPQLIFNIPSR